MTQYYVSSILQSNSIYKFISAISLFQLNFVCVCVYKLNYFATKGMGNQFHREYKNQTNNQTNSACQTTAS